MHKNEFESIISNLERGGVWEATPRKFQHFIDWLDDVNLHVRLNLEMHEGNVIVRFYSTELR